MLINPVSQSDNSYNQNFKSCKKVVRLGAKIKYASWLKMIEPGEKTSELYTKSVKEAYHYRPKTAKILNKALFRYGSLFSPDLLIRISTGKKLSTEDFIKNIT